MLKAFLTATNEWVKIQGQVCRVYRGRTAGGVPCTFLVRAMSVEPEHEDALIDERAGLIDPWGPVPALLEYLEDSPPRGRDVVEIGPLIMASFSGDDDGPD